MEYRTGYFAKLNKYIKEGYYPVSIARYNPRGMKLFQWVRVAPSEDLLRDYKNDKIDEIEYEFRYLNYLQSLDILKDLEYIENVVHKLNTSYKGVVFLCYEKDGFCHRHILADFLRTRNIDVEELRGI